MAYEMRNGFVRDESTDALLVTGITAGDPLSGIPEGIVDLKGDLITATGADTPVRQGVGANGTVLTADSTAATGLRWVAPEVTQSELDALDGRLDTAEAALPNKADTSALTAHEADTSAVHGIADTAALMAVAVHNGTAYPTRPTAPTVVMWIGPVAPTIGTGSAINGDLWTNTA